MSAEWEAAIAAEEAAIVGLPQRGLVLLRAAGAEHAALCRYPSGVPLWQPAGAPTSLAVGDNGLWAAVMVSTSDEASRLWLVHTRERRATRIAAAAFRHDAPRLRPRERRLPSGLHTGGAAVPGDAGPSTARRLPRPPR
ncbi:hypothetical protein DWB68_14685 [Galactobacter valiniphilus]|uniref:Uncharacterized protein n=1 Tax=Galactobacter valiniphilus TaxID=2676122 RepID=A0A399J7C8_9MICC|nr:hypothetical protein [Galactobacter valiniphilus]RII41040.1 hypothetical protein DWB68_14685 [Galactobacter valiniphilus]